MNKTIWIFNHYAGPPSISTGLRHYCFGKYLLKSGYNVTVFSASTVHNSDKNLIEKDGPRYIEDDSEGVPFVFVKTRPYAGNGKARVLNMLDYYFNLFMVAKKFKKPDVIYASSVHPLACVAGIKIAKRMRIPCICETRDLWPESIVEFNGVNAKSLAIRLVDHIVKWTYKKADALIFTMEGGKQYIKDKLWEKSVSLGKVFYINNGIDLEEFDRNVGKNNKDDGQLANTKFHVIYAGAIRQANNIDVLLEVAKIVQKSVFGQIVFDIYGDGDDKERLIKEANDKNLSNIIFHGNVPKAHIPKVLSKGNVSILTYLQAETWKYGSSNNKLFEYLAAAKPVVSTIRIGYSIIDQYKAGITADTYSPQAIANAVLKIYDFSPEKYEKYCSNARRAAEDFTYEKLTERLIEVIESV